MPRTRKGAARTQAHKKIRKLAKGNYGGRRRLYRTVRETLTRAMAYAFRDRKRRKSDFRRLWIVRIGAASLQRGMTYSRFMSGLTKAQVSLDRKMLAEIAVNDAPAFDKLVELAKAAAG